ncbi:hypothetical protein [Thomasclavelia sp.]
MKKKLLTGMLSMAVMAAMALPVYAADDTTTVTYSQTSTWTVSIPATTVNAASEVKKELSVAAINIEPGKKLQVKIGKDKDNKDIANGIVTLKRTTDTETVTTTVSTGSNKSNPVSTGTVIAEFQNQDKTPASGGKLYFSAINESDAKAGEYSGTMTYTMATADIN